MNESTAQLVELDEDQYFSTMRDALGANSIVKMEFVNFLSGLINYERIFAFEGPDDKTVYQYWVNRLRNGLGYEPYVCKNKHKTLQLFDAILRDRTGLSGDIFFFVDHDFDGLQGRDPHESVFVTDKYSVENYVVCTEVLESLLKNEFHCENQQLRTEIGAIFKRVYAEFLNVTKDINFRIYAARRFKINQIEDLPTRLSRIANVSLNAVRMGDAGLYEVVKLARELEPEEMQIAMAEFAKVSAEDNYRGKFALYFFSKWLGLLRTERLADDSEVFVGIPKSEYGIKGDFSFDVLAPKAPIPTGLQAFLAQVA